MAKKSRQKKSSSPASSSNIRDVIRAEVAAKGLTGYSLVELLAGRVSRTAVYRFLADGGTTDVKTAEAFCEVLGLGLVKRRK